MVTRVNDLIHAVKEKYTASIYLVLLVVPIVFIV